MPDGNLLWPLILQVVLITLNAIFACAEIAVISTSDIKLEKLSEEGNKKAKKLSKLKKDPAKFLATIQVAITLSGFLGSAFAANTFSEPLVRWFMNLTSTPETYHGALDAVAVVLITLILSYFTLVFGELVPKRMAMKNAESIALGITSLIKFISVLFAPVVYLLTASTNTILRMFGIDPNDTEEEVSEEDIRMMVDSASEQEAIDEEEKELIQNVFEFDDLTVGEFCTHRTDLDILYADDDLSDWAKTIQETRHSLYPICEETVDKVVGILSTKDYFRMEERTKEAVMEKAVKTPYFIPESIHADVLLRQMKETRNHFAVVLDEYGGTAGVVTMNDLLEQIVGDLETEVEEENIIPEIESIGENTWRIQGCAPLEEVAEELGIELPVEEYETFGGFVFSSYGSIPDDGTTLELDIDNLHVNVTEIRDHRVESSIVILSVPEGDEDEDDEREDYGTDE